MLPLFADGATCPVCVHAQLVQLFVILWALTLQALLFMGFLRQEYWSRLPCPPPSWRTDGTLHWQAPACPEVKSCIHSFLQQPFTCYFARHCLASTWNTKMRDPVVFLGTQSDRPGHYFFFPFSFWPCGLWDPNSPTRDWTWAPAVEAWRPNHWTARAIPRPPSLTALPIPLSQEAVGK